MSKNPFRQNFDLNLTSKHTSSLDMDESALWNTRPNTVVSRTRKNINTRLFQGLVIGVAVLFMLRLLVLQVIDHSRYRALAEGNRLRTQYLLAPRGMIYDAYGSALLHNEPIFELVITPVDLPKDPILLEREIMAVSEFFGIEIEVIRQKIRTLNRASLDVLTLQERVPQDKAIVFIANEQQYPGFAVQNNPSRSYEQGVVFSHVLGYTGKLTESEYAALKGGGYLYNDVVGKTGLERTYEKQLRGTFGERAVEVDARGAVKKVYRHKESRPGAELHLALDAELQNVLHAAITRQLQVSGARRAAAVALDPKTGGVRALVSIPGYDNNLYSQGMSAEGYRALVTDPDQPLFNRAISGTYPPGSTVKPFIGAAVLQEGIVSDTKRIYDGGAIVVPNQFNPAIRYTFRGWKPEGLGSVNLYDAIALSSDIYFYTVGGGQKDLAIEGLGPDALASYFKKFLFGQVAGIDLPSEKAGLIPTPEWKALRFIKQPAEAQWFLGDTYNMSIGQGFLLVTPLQLAVATAALANGGMIMRPHIVEYIKSQDGESIHRTEPQVLNRDFIQPTYLAAARKGMRQAVTNGTARLLNTLPIAVAGKTGTSQFDGADLKRTHAWFTSFAPYENPTLALTILVEAGGEGTTAAVPVAREVYEWYSKHRL